MYPLQKVPHVLQNSTNNKLPTLDNLRGPGPGPALEARWLEHQGLHVLVFDASAPSAGASEVSSGESHDLRGLKEEMLGFYK